MLVRQLVARVTKAMAKAATSRWVCGSGPGWKGAIIHGMSVLSHDWTDNSFMLIPPCTSGNAIARLLRQWRHVVTLRSMVGCNAILVAFQTLGKSSKTV